MWEQNPFCHFAKMQVSVSQMSNYSVKNTVWERTATRKVLVDTVFKLLMLTPVMFNWDVNTAISFGGAGWSKKEGFGREHASVVRACFALHHAIPTAHLGAGVGGDHPHNGSVSYPMRPVQLQTDGQNRQMTNLQDETKKRPDRPTVEHITEVCGGWTVNSDKGCATKAWTSHDTANWNAWIYSVCVFVSETKRL